MSTAQRNLWVAGGVVLAHAAILWGLQAVLGRPTVEVMIPVHLLSRIIPAPPQTAPAPPAPPPLAPRPPPARREAAERVPTRSPAAQPAAMPAIARPDPGNAPAKPDAVSPPQSAPITTGGSAAATPAAPAQPAVAAAPPSMPAPAPAPSKLELPSSDAAYLQNPPPAYPPMSKRLGEQGKVTIRALIGVDGSVQRADIGQSSGYERLDRAALSAVLRWRFVPGKRDGAPAAMWHNIPVVFVLE